MLSNSSMRTPLGSTVRRTRVPPDASMSSSGRSRGNCTAPFIGSSLRHAPRGLGGPLPRIGGSDADKQTSLSVLIVVP